MKRFLLCGFLFIALTPLHGESLSYRPDPESSYIYLLSGFRLRNGKVLAPTFVSPFQSLYIVSSNIGTPTVAIESLADFDLVKKTKGAVVGKTEYCFNRRTLFVAESELLNSFPHVSGNNGNEKFWFGSKNFHYDCYKREKVTYTADDERKSLSDTVLVSGKADFNIASNTLCEFREYTLFSKKIGMPLAVHSSTTYLDLKTDSRDVITGAIILVAIIPRES